MRGDNRDQRTRSAARAESRSCPSRERWPLILIALPSALAFSIAREAQAAGYCPWLTDGLDFPFLATGTPSRLTVALTIDQDTCFDNIATLRRRFPSALIVGVASRSSVWRLAEAVRRGATSIVVQPSSLRELLAPDPADDAREHATPMSLDRSLWEYLMQAVLEAGSISAAARRLELDRTSLKRMLRKVPPLVYSENGRTPVPGRQTPSRRRGCG